MIVVDYALLADTQTQLQKTSGALGGQLQDLQSRLRQMTWEGQDQAAYDEHMRQWRTAVDELNALLAEIGVQVGNTSQRFSEGEARRAASWSG